jgi:hypothetical protein
MNIWFVLATSLWLLAWAAEAGYCEYDPHLVYGVKEPNEGMYISDECMEALEPDRDAQMKNCSHVWASVIERYASSVNKGYACGYIYGCDISFDDIISNTKTDDMKAVDIFAMKCKLGEPEYMVALSGDCEDAPNIERYNPISKDTDANDSQDETTSGEEAEAENQIDNDGNEVNKMQTPSKINGASPQNDLMRLSAHHVSTQAMRLKTWTASALAIKSKSVPMNHRCGYWGSSCPKHLTV